MSTRPPSSSISSSSARPTPWTVRGEAELHGGVALPGGSSANCPVPGYRGKVVTAFGTTLNAHAGGESTLLSAYTARSTTRATARPSRAQRRRPATRAAASPPQWRH
ncbi:hypothetical protein [Streptomyces sp. NPDC002671]